jgi:hypothetical protein
MRGNMDFAKNYTEFSDQKLIDLAKYEYHDLLPEAQFALNNELRKRNLFQNVNEFHEIVKESISKEEFDEIAKQYRKFDCPTCGEKFSGVNVITMDYFYFLIVMIFWGNKVFVGCSHCLIEQSNNYKRKLLIMMIVFPIQTILSLIYYFQCNHIIWKIRNNNEPTKEYYAYVHKNIYDIKQLIKNKI